jgi:hypothetical protein
MQDFFFGAQRTRRRHNDHKAGPRKILRELKSHHRRDLRVFVVNFVSIFFAKATRVLCVCYSLVFFIYSADFVFSIFFGAQ